ncbi:MAG: hypothetical protein ABW136_06470 [Steroidobacteraceae bacterium]
MVSLLRPVVALVLTTSLLSACRKPPEAPPPPPPVAAVPCDRACLEQLVDQYLDALQNHDPHRIHITPDFRLTENGVQLEIGDGLWRTLTARGSYRMVVADAEAGHVAFLGSIREDDIPAMLALHLVVRNRRIAAVESFVQRDEKSALGFEKIGYTWTEPLAEADRVSRADLLRVSNAYFTGLQRNDGKGDYPFADDCNRIENGTNSTNVPVKRGETRADPKTATRYSAQWSCREQFESGLLYFVTRVRDRRFVAVDVERGLTFSFVFFDHSAGDTRRFRSASGQEVTAGPRQPWTWQLAEAFRVEKGQIRQIMAIMERVPYGMNSGWSTWEQGMSSVLMDATKPSTPKR